MTEKAADRRRNFPHNIRANETASSEDNPCTRVCVHYKRERDTVDRERGRDSLCRHTIAFGCYRKLLIVLTSASHPARLFHIALANFHGSLRVILLG